MPQQEKPATNSPIVYKGMTAAVEAASARGISPVSLSNNNIGPLLCAWLLLVTNKKFWFAQGATGYLDDAKRTQFAESVGLTKETVDTLLDTAHKNYTKFGPVADLFQTIAANADYPEPAGCPNGYAPIAALGNQNS